jgi:hypothetical protein
LNTPQFADVVPLLHNLGPLPVSEEWAGWLGEEQEEKGFRRKLVNCTGKEEQTSLNNLTESKAHGLRNGRPKDEEPSTLDCFAI